MSQQLPGELISSLQTVKGFDENEFIRVHGSGEQVVSVRHNPAKSMSPADPSLEKVPWSSHGYYLSQRPSFTADPLFHAGTYYVQEASSMFLEEAIRQTCNLSQSLRVLDLCAAPGGKSTLMQSLLSEDSLLVSNELIKTRVTILTENISKWGSLNVVVTNNDPKDFQRLAGYFDLIVVDAPCSGSGLFRKDPGAIDEWSAGNVALCSQRQQRILSDVMPALKPGGVLIYSTCSYSMEEDEAIADWMLSAFHTDYSGVQLKLKEEWNIVESVSPVHNAYGYRFYPNRLKGEGFFIAAFKNIKTGGTGNAGHWPGNAKSRLPLLTKVEAEIAAAYFSNAAALTFFKWQDEVLAFPAGLMNDLHLLQSALYIRKAGIKTGSLIRNELIPDHELAMSSLLSDDIPSIHVNREDALQYLRRQDISIESNISGWAIIRFENTALGWVKILPNRVNNYYPKSWRILNK